MRVEQFMTKNPIACETHDRVRDVARLMREKGVGFVVVLEHGRVAGVVTDRQLTCGPLADGVVDAPVSTIMTRGPATVDRDDTMFSLIDTLRSAGVVRRVPVVNADNELIGVVSLSDLAVIAKDLVDAILLEETHHALREARVPTGGKELVRHMRRPTKEDRLPPGPQVRPVTARTPMPPPADVRAPDVSEYLQ